MIDWIFLSVKLIKTEVMKNMLEYILSIFSFFAFWLYTVYCGRIKFALRSINNILLSMVFSPIHELVGFLKSSLVQIYSKLNYKPYDYLYRSQNKDSINT